MARNTNVRKNDKRIIFKISILLLAVYLIFSMISLQSQLVEQRKILKERQNQITELKASNEEIKSLLENGSENELIERAARDKLDFVYINEEIYEDIKGN